MRLPEYFGALELLAPGLGVLEITPPSDIGDEPWGIAVKSGEAVTAENAWVKRPPV
jgi:hypothetical protein